MLESKAHREVREMIQATVDAAVQKAVADVIRRIARAIDSVSVPLVEDPDSVPNGVPGYSESKEIAQFKRSLVRAIDGER
jgi:hypothetical protein